MKVSVRFFLTSDNYLLDIFSEDYTIRWNRKYFNTPTYFQCRSNARSDAQNCEKRHGKDIDATLILQDSWGTSSRYCELRFNVPSENLIQQESVDKTKPVFHPPNPLNHSPAPSGSSLVGGASNE